MSEEESLKRTRTSPRTNAFNEVISLIDEYIRQEDGALDPPSEARLTLLMVREGVSGLIGTQHDHKGNNDDTSTTSVGKKGTHYIVVTGNGTALYLRRKDGEYHTSDGDAAALVVIYGPCKTKAGCEYAIQHNTYAILPRVM